MPYRPVPTMPMQPLRSSVVQRMEVDDDWTVVKRMEVDDDWTVVKTKKEIKEEKQEKRSRREKDQAAQQEAQRSIRKYVAGAGSMAHELTSGLYGARSTVTVYQKGEWTDQEWKRMSEDQQALLLRQRDNAAKLKNAGINVKFKVDVTRPRSQSRTDNYEETEYRHPHGKVYGDEKSDSEAQDQACCADMTQLMKGFFKTSTYKTRKSTNGRRAAVVIRPESYPWNDGEVDTYYGGRNRKRPTVSLVEIAQANGWRLSETAPAGSGLGERNVGTEIGGGKRSTRYTFEKD